jgi:hypothetical protein
VTASWLSPLVALLTALSDQPNGVHCATFVLAALVFGGFIAWLARDLTAVVERSRQ